MTEEANAFAEAIERLRDPSPSVRLGMTALRSRALLQSSRGRVLERRIAATGYIREPEFIALREGM